MRTNRTQDTKKYLSFRVDRSLWIRLGDVIRRAGTTTQAFCTDAIERHIARYERQQNDPDDLNGKSARSVADKMRKKPTE